MYKENIDSSRHSVYNIGDNVYYSLRKNIIALNFKPGETLSIKDISEKLNVSRSPVRDALMKLGKEGLVDIVPQKGTSVSQIHLKRVDEEQFLRKSLEESAMKLFVKVYKESDIAILKNNIEMQKQCLNDNDYLSFLDYDDDFHSVFFQSINKSMCWEIIQSMSGHYRRARLMSLWDDKILINVVTQHQEIIENICNENHEKAIELSKMHLSKISLEETELIKKYPEYFKEEDNENFLIKDFYSRM